MTAVTTRFAPSPTGYLHVGGARTALFSWLLARHEKGAFLLRIEDTDLARSTQAACDQLLEDLRWLGLHWDNPQLVLQSQRVDIYNKLIDDLIARGLAYEAWESNEELTAERKAAEAAKRGFIYRRRPVSEQQIKEWKAAGRVPVVRFVMPSAEQRFDDAVLQKPIVMPEYEAQDFVIRKADGMPTYHFAVVVDDAAMNVTHILRGQEHLKNTFYHIALQEALGYPRPVYGHLPVIQNLDGSKMGKRDRDKKIRLQSQLWIKNGRGTAQTLATQSGVDPATIQSWLKDSKSQLDLPEQAAVMPVVGLAESDLPEILVHDFRHNGYLPEALLNFLALLGWSPGEDREQMGMDEMVQRFSLAGINVSNAKFARDKLLAFNTDFCAKASPQRLLAAFRDYLSVNPDSPLNRADDAMLARLLEIKKGFRTLREVDEINRFLFTPDEQIVYQPDAVDKVLKKQDSQGFAVLKAIHELFQGAAHWSHVELESLVKTYCEQAQLALGKVAQPIRVAVTGTTISPSIFESLELLGKTRTLARIERCLLLQSAS